MAKIAVEFERALARRAVNGSPGRTTARVLAQGDGWTVADVVCTSGPRDHPFEERHAHVNIAIVAAGSFQYRSAAGRALMTPGALTKFLFRQMVTAHRTTRMTVHLIESHDSSPDREPRR